VWLILVGLVGAAFTYVSRALAEKHSVMGIGARVELAFPELDNHLINFLQFSDDRTGDPFKEAYVKRGGPELSRAKLRNMKNRKAHMRANTALVIAVFMMAVPVAFTGKAWAVAVWRLVNPFSDVQPISQTHILEVTPGDSTALLGSPLVLNCRIAGKRGHKVHLDLKPADDDKTVYSIGNIRGRGEEDFFYGIAKVTTHLKYRFRAGDSPFPEWHTIKARAPLAMTSVHLAIKPPVYTKGDTRTFEGMSDEVFIPRGSDVTVTVKCNSALKSATVLCKEKKPVALAETGQKNTWRGTVTVEAGDSLMFEATDAYDDELANAVNYTLVADRPPVISILAPKGRIMLPPGTAPNIEFAVVDDYGLAGITVERVVAGSAREAGGKVVKTWKIAGDRDFTGIWSGENRKSSGTDVMAFRIRARDNCPYEQHVSRSASILFDPVDMSNADKIQNSFSRKADVALGRAIDLQKENIRKTKQYRNVLDLTGADQWQELAGTQTQIRKLTRTILTNPVRPLGNLTESVKNAYMNEMAIVIAELGRVPKVEAPEKPRLVASSLNMEEKILRCLTYADLASAQARIQQKVSMLTGLLRALIKGESDVVKRTTAFAENQAEVSETLVDKQDDLADDLSEFVNACRTDAAYVRENEPNLAAAFERASARCAETKIRDDMMMASERLECNEANNALTHENSALAKLKAVRNALNAVKSAEEKEKREEMLEVLDAANARISKIRALHQRALETMETVKANENMDTKELDMMEEEYEELRQITKEALLEVPTDLHIYQELNCANDIVEDVISVFEEIEQAEDSENDLQEGAVHEKAYSKDDSLAYLELLEQAEGRLDMFEKWLMDEPDTTKVTVEAMDQEEMPDEGAALGALQTEAEDLIGDLLEESQDPEDQDLADDSAVNRAVGDMPGLGWAVMEGDVTTFAAKGKSGNARPDHKEQDGRSNIGRQGMSGGETAAGSGTIQEGDDNIEARRTQDPTQSGQVDVDGEADTRASGGGKQATGRADDVGDGLGGTQRMDSTMGGSREGMEALMVKVERMYEQASMKNVRAPSLKLAAHHIRQATDAIADARPIDQVNELKRKAVAALRRARTELGAGSTAALDSGSASSMLDDVVEGGADEAPPQYRDLVNKYYTALNETI